MGSSPWKAPELLNMDYPVYTRETDIHALGWVLWEMLTKKTPYLEVIHNRAVVEDKIWRGEQEQIPKDAPEKYAVMIHSC